MSDLELLDLLIGDIKDRIYDLKDDIRRTDSRLVKQNLTIRIDELANWLQHLIDMREENW